LLDAFERFTWAIGAAYTEPASCQRQVQGSEETAVIINDQHPRLIF